MEDGPPSELALLLQSGFLVSRLTFRPLTHTQLLIYGAITLYGWLFQTILINFVCFPRPGSFPFARRYSENLG